MAEAVWCQIESQHFWSCDLRAGSGGPIDGWLSQTESALADPDKLEALVSGILRAQAYRGEAATALGEDRYALIRDRSTPAQVFRQGAVRHGIGVAGAACKQHRSNGASTGFQRDHRI